MSSGAFFSLAAGLAGSLAGGAAGFDARAPTAGAPRMPAMNKAARGRAPSGGVAPQLGVARKPTPCMRDGGDAEHVFYTRLVNDLAIYGIGLAKRDRTVARLAALLEQYRKQPATFACGLVPRQAPGTPRSGCA